jgi:hypothetical protein
MLICGYPPPVSSQASPSEPLAEWAGEYTAAFAHSLKEQVSDRCN